jgi:hypothetical protein
MNNSYNIKAVPEIEFINKIFRIGNSIKIWNADYYDKILMNHNHHKNLRSKEI